MPRDSIVPGSHTVIQQQLCITHRNSNGTAYSLFIGMFPNLILMVDAIKEEITIMKNRLLNSSDA